MFRPLSFVPFIAIAPAVLVGAGGSFPLWMQAAWWQCGLVVALAIFGVLAIARPRRQLTATASMFFVVSWLAIGFQATLQVIIPGALASGWWPIGLQMACLLVAQLIATTHIGALHAWERLSVAVGAVLLVIVVGSLAQGGLGYRQQFVWPSLNVNLIVNILGPVMVAGALGYFSRAPGDRRLGWQQALLFGGLAALLVVSVWTGRRAFWWALVTAGVLTFAASDSPRRGWRMLAGGCGIALALVGLLAGAGFLSGIHEADQLRPLAYRAAWATFWSSPWWGIGPLAGFRMHGLDLEACQNLTMTAGHVTHCHSSVLESLASTGIIGAVFMLIQFGLLFRAWRQQPASWWKWGIACGGGMLLLTTAVDATGAHLLSHLVIGAFCGALMNNSQAIEEPAAAPRMLQNGALLLGVVACTWISSSLFSLCSIFQSSPTPVFLAALKKTYDPEHVIDLTSQAYERGLAQKQRWQCLEALSLSRQKAGFFGIQIAYWTNQALIDAPNRERIALLEELIRRVPFQDDPYLTLANIHRNEPGLTVDERYLRRAAWLADSAAIDPAVWERPLATNDAAIDLWAAAASAASKRTIPARAAPRLYELIHRWRQSPGVSLMAVWVCAHQEVLDPATVVADTPGLFWTLRMQSGIHVAFDAITDPADCARILPLVSAIESGGNLPEPTIIALARVRHLAGQVVP